MIEIILLFKITAAVIALESKNLLSAVISLGGVGFGLAVIMVFLGAPDVALVQILIEVVLLIILIKATVSRDETDVKGQGEYFNIILCIALLGLLYVAVLYVLAVMPRFGYALPQDPSYEIPSLVYLTRGIEHTGSANIVTAILLGYRAFDSLGEAAVLFAAVAGALTILRKAKKDEEK